MMGNRKWSAGQEREVEKKREMSETKANFPGVLKRTEGVGKKTAEPLKSRVPGCSTNRPLSDTARSGQIIIIQTRVEREKEEGEKKKKTKLKNDWH